MTLSAFQGVDNQLRELQTIYDRKCFSLDNSELLLFSTFTVLDDNSATLLGGSPATAKSSALRLK